MDRTFRVFYSWQAGPHDRENRYLIGDCLQSVARQLAGEGITLLIEQDMRGAAGSADIPQTVFQKIEAADCFVGDLTTINPDAGDQRKTPNPNVLIELGYAAHAHGWERLIFVFNKRFGQVEEAPFDIRHRRMLMYHSGGEPAAVKRSLTAQLLRAIRGVLECPPLPKDDVQQAKASLAGVLLAGIRHAWHELVTQDDEEAGGSGYQSLSLEAGAPVLLEIHKQQATMLETILAPEEYVRLSDLLDHIQHMRHGTEGAHGWEYVRALAEYCFEPVWMEYWEALRPLRPEQCLRQEIIQLLNALLPEEDQLRWEELRTTEDGIPVFSASASRVAAYDRTGKRLIDGTVDEKGRFTGWKHTWQYDGEFIAGLRHGSGTEYFCAFRGHGVRREGRWERGAFVEGTLHDNILIRDETAEDGYAYKAGADDGPLHLYEANLNSMICAHMPEECKDLYVGDLYLHDGLYDIVGAPAPLCPKLGGPEHPACYDCPEEAYLDSL